MLFLPVAMNVLLLSACATTKGYDTKIHAWPGQPAAQLIKKWGEPDLILPLKNGHKEYQYLKDQEVTVPQQNTDPFAYNRELREREGTRHSQVEPFTPKGYSWGSNSVSPSFSLFSASLDSYNGTGLKKMLYCHTFFEINSNGRIISVRFKGNHCLA